MKISNKEKTLLATVGIVALGAGYYQFVFTPQREKVKEVESKYTSLQSDYDNKKLAISSIGKNKEAIVALKGSIDDVSNFIYPEIWQEKITKEISTIKSKTGLKGSLSFEKPSYMPIAAYFEAKQEEQNTQKTLDDLMKDYNGVALKDESQEGKTEDNAKKEEIKNKLEETKKLGEEQREKTKATPTPEEQKFAVKQMKVTMNFSGTHTQLISFIKEIDKYERLVAVPDITMAASGEGSTEVTGNLSLEFYAVPKVGDEDLDYFDWNGSGISGKENPFNDLYTSKPNGVQSSETAVMINLRPAASDLPSIMMGRPGDNDKKTYVETVGNKKEIIEVEFTSSGGKYYISYKIGDKKYPTKGGEEIKVAGMVIPMDVNSAPRQDATDKVAAQIIVKNKTDKKVAVSIRGDDKENPRVTVIPQGDVQYTNVQ